MLFIFLMLLGQGLYFENATTYDVVTQQLVANQHVVIDDMGNVVAVSAAPIEQGAQAEMVVADALILPHFSDFYSLTQERGLGLDQDLDVVNQAMLMNNYRRGGVFLVRDPMFPAEGVDDMLTQGVALHALRGYVDLVGGPAADFSIVADPLLSPGALLNELPDEGPVTLWWTSLGGDVPLLWADHLDYIKRLRTLLREKNRKLGVYVQDATVEEVRLLEKLVVDFVEGMPAEPSKAWRSFGDAVWVPLAALNDKRYCAKNLDDRMIDAANRGLYGRKMVSEVRERLRGIHVQMMERCDIWQKRRSEVLSSLTAWIAAGGKLGVGSAGGHPFSFSGDIRMEVSVLAEFGAKERDLFQALFQHTPQLIGSQPAYLQLNQPAHFIVFINDQNQAWHDFVGKRVDFNFTSGVSVVKPK